MFCGRSHARGVDENGGGRAFIRVAAAHENDSIHVRNARRHVLDSPRTRRPGATRDRPEQAADVSFGHRRSPRCRRAHHWLGAMGHARRNAYAGPSDCVETLGPGEIAHVPIMIDWMPHNRLMMAALIDI